MNRPDQAIEAASKIADPLLVLGALITLALFRTGFLDGIEGEAASILTFGTIAAAVHGSLRYAIERVRDRCHADAADETAQRVGENVGAYLESRLEKAARSLGWDSSVGSVLGWIENLPDPEDPEPSRHLLPDGSYSNRATEALAAWYAVAPAEVVIKAQAADTARRIGSAAPEVDP